MKGSLTQRDMQTKERTRKRGNTNNTENNTEKPDRQTCD